MRLSRKSLPVILIASGLILVAASKGKAQPSAAPTSKAPAIQSHTPTAGDHDDAGEGQPPQTAKSPFEAELVEALRAMVRQQQTARIEDQANEKRWWPPSPSWAIVYVTVIYVVVAIFTLLAVKRQADIADDSLHQVQRGRISLHGIECLLQDNVWFVRIRFKNLGNGPAFTTSISWGAFANGTGNMADAYKLGESLPGGEETRWWRLHMPADYPSSGKELIVQGQLSYTDGFQVDHVTAFRRAYRNGQFVPDGGEQYNYEK